jgi:hypothetical protein
MNEDSLDATKEALSVADEKLMMTKFPMALGENMMFKGAAAPVASLGSKLATFSGLTSGVVEVAGAFMTPFGTTAIYMAQKACECQAK